MADREPLYAFSIPSVHDDLALSCRIYQPLADAVWKGQGAVVAHPYAPLGGCFDDPVVLATTEALLKQSYFVGTFNFRGAGDSEGRTSWTGKAEQDDYVSFAGFMIYFLNGLRAAGEKDRLETIQSATGTAHGTSSANIEHIHSGKSLHMILAGYSYGSLILARLPPVPAIIMRFESAERGTAAAEIILRAQTLAKQTLKSLEETKTPTSPQRGRQLDPKDAESPQSPSRRIGVSPITVGGEETDPSSRRRSRDSRRSVDIVRRSLDAPHRIKAHIKGANSLKRRNGDANTEAKTTSAGYRPVVISRYLVVSPVLLPFTNVLAPSGPPSMMPTARKDTNGDSRPGSSFLCHNTLAIFGSHDALTPSRRLRAWAEKVAVDSKGGFEWEQIESAGHFWREKGVLQALQNRVQPWTQSSIP